MAGEDCHGIPPPMCVENVFIKSCYMFEGLWLSFLLFFFC